jgi:chemotaxis protein CheX
MHVHQDITEALVHDFINKSITDVFKTMLGLEAQLVKGTAEAAAEPWPPLHAGREGSKPHIVGSVGFIGDANGLVYLYLDLDFASTCTRELLGMTAQELAGQGEEVVNDAIAELTNMSVGGFKNRLCDAGYPCMLTIPSILRGTNFCVEPTSSSKRHIYHFDCAGHRVVVDILMKEGD